VLTLPFFFTEAQVSTFETFWVDTLRRGAEEFEFPHPRTGNIVTCRLLSVPQLIETNPGLYRVTLTFEVKGPDVA
jgi:hypothetical protein